MCGCRRAAIYKYMGDKETFSAVAAALRDRAVHGRATADEVKHLESLAAYFDALARDPSAELHPELRYS
jgi:hypothetical protein